MESEVNVSEIITQLLQETNETHLTRFIENLAESEAGMMDFEVIDSFYEEKWEE